MGISILPFGHCIKDELRVATLDEPSLWRLPSPFAQRWRDVLPAWREQVSILRTGWRVVPSQTEGVAIWFWSASWVSRRSPKKWTAHVSISDKTAVSNGPLVRDRRLSCRLSRCQWRMFCIVTSVFASCKIRAHTKKAGSGFDRSRDWSEIDYHAMVASTTLHPV